MEVRLPSPFDAGLKVLVLAGSDPVTRRKARRRERRIERGEREVPLQDKAFSTLRGRLVIEHVLDWLAEAGLREIWVLAPPVQLARIPERYAIRPIPQHAGARIFANLSLACSALAPAPGEPVLVVFGDHPLNTSRALADFLRRCGALLGSADFFHALALRSSYTAFDRWFRRTSMHLREMSGRASGLNLAVPSRLHRLAVIDEMYEVRKLERMDSLVGLLWRLVRWLGTRSAPALADALVVFLAKECEKRGRGGRAAPAFGLFERLLARTVPAARLERYAARVLQAERGVRLIPVAHGGLAIDVDFAEELATLERSWDELAALCRLQDAALEHPAP